jgi:ABC-2 type transport system permease protein
MYEDMLTVMWKERKGLFRVQGSPVKTLLTLLVPVVMIAIVMPIQLGQEWTSGAWPVIAAVLIPLIVVGIMIPQSFAGERERHTLETLLASRLPDRAILFGKVTVAIAYGWGMSLIVLLVGLVPVNLLHWAGHIVVYDPGIALVTGIVGLLASGMIANLGVLISLRAATAQGAQQVLISTLMIPLLVLQVVPMVLLGAVPNGREILKQWLSIDFTPVFIGVIAVLVVLNVGLLLAAMARFQRSRLSLG